MTCLIAISDDENSDSGDLAVTSDILPKQKGRARKPITKEEVEEDDTADTKVPKGDADEDDEDEDGDDDDMDEDE
jgi:hypothetical protein